MNESLLALLPPSISRILERIPSAVAGMLEEIRVRERRPLEIGFRGGFAFLSPEGGLLEQPLGAYEPTREDCVRLLELLTHHSVYSFEEELKRGFITIAGGHRVGLAGRTVLEHSRVKHLRDISGFNIRIAREIPGCADQVLPQIADAGSGGIHHTLVVSPPQHGKTTLIRDLARLISCRGRKVGIVDERSELAACVRGVPSFDVGPRTDILDGCPKAEGMMMMIRSMSPDVLIVDEIGRSEDATAIREAAHAGIRVIASAHGAGLEDVARRPVLGELIASGLFGRSIVLTRRNGVPEVAGTYDAAGRALPAATLRHAGWR